MSSLYEAGWLILVDRPDNSGNYGEIIIYCFYASSFATPVSPLLQGLQLKLGERLVRTSLCITSFKAVVLSIISLDHMSGGECLRTYVELQNFRASCETCKIGSA